MIIFNNSVFKLCGLAVLAVFGIGQKALAQAVIPVITPKTNIVVKLDNTGYHANLLAEFATALNPDGSKPTVVAINPTSFDCSKTGPQTVKITAVNYKPINADGTDFKDLTDITFDAAGNMYVTEGDSYMIDKVTPNGFIYNYSGGGIGTNNPDARNGYVNGSGTMARYEYVTGVVADASGVLYVTDLNNRVRRVSVGLAEGTSTTFAGSGLDAYADGRGTAASFRRLNGIALDSHGNVFVNDEGNSLIRKITPAGDVTTFAGQVGVRSYQDGTGTAATFTHLNGIFIDPADNIYIADGNKIRKVSPTGDVTTIAGTGESGYVDGPVAIAKFDMVKDIVMDSGGNLFVSDFNNNRIRKITTSGVVSTFAGSGLTYFGDGTGISANLNGPAGMAMDAIGNIYLTEINNHDVRKITPDGAVVRYMGEGASFHNVGILGGGINGSSTQTVTVTVQSDLQFTDHPDVTVGPDITCTAVMPDFTQGAHVTSCPSSNITVTQSPIAGTALVLDVPTPVTLTALDQNGATTTTSFNVTYKNAPVITPLNQITKLALDPSGSYKVQVKDLASITTCDGSTPEIKISPAILDCSKVGPQTITITASKPALSTPANVRFKEPAGLAIDASGNIYVADGGNFAIRKITPAGVVTTIAGGTSGKTNGVGTNAQFYYPVGVAVDAVGNLFVADKYNRLIRKITPDGTVSTFAGGGTNLEGKGTLANLSFPNDLVFDSGGNLFVLDNDYSLIKKITPDAQVTTFAGQLNVRASIDGSGVSAAFTGLDGMAIDKQNNIYIADQNLIRKITASGWVTTIAGNPAVEGYADGTGAAAKFNLIEDIVADAAGNLYVTDYHNNRIRKITPGGVVTTFAGDGSAGSANGVGTAASFNGPRGMVMDAAGNIYVSEIGNNDIRKITPDGVVSTFAGQLADGLIDGNIGGDVYASSTKTFNVMVTTTPQFAAEADKVIAADANCNVLVPDYARNANILNACSVATLTVTQVPAAGTPLAINTPKLITLTAKDQFGGQGTVSFTVTASSKPVIIPFAQPVTIKLGTGGTYTTKLSDLATITMCDSSTPVVTISPAALDCSKLGTQVLTITAKNATSTNNQLAASFNSPMSIVTDAAGNSYIADFLNQKIRKITPDGVVSTLAGTGIAGFDEGTGAIATFNSPRGLTIDGAGNVYVADYANNRIRKITPDGKVSTFAGSGVPSSLDGVGTAANINSPYKIAADNAGNLYVADYGGNRIRKILPNASVTTIAGSNSFGGVDGPGYLATFNNVTGICVDLSGNVYVIDNASRIRKIDPTGIVSTYAGTATPGYKDGPALTAQFNTPAGITSDPAGNLYVADKGNKCIRKIGIDGQVSTIVSATAVNLPEDLTIDRNGNILVVDAGYQNVLQISPDGTVTTIAGRGQPGSADGRVGIPDVAVTKQVTVNVVGDLTFNAPLNDVIIPLSATCPTAIPDYAAKATASSTCSNKITYTQLPAAGTLITGTTPIILTITATDDLGGKATTSFKLTPDGTAQPAPTAIITASAQTICDGSAIDFIVKATNVAGLPTYHWLLNGKATGADQDTYSNSTLKDGDVVSCDVKSTTGCLTTTTAPGVAIKVNANVKPDFKISATSLEICAGSTVTFFAANLTNAGTAPTFQWLVNNTPVTGATNASFTTGALVTGDKVSCILINTDAGCFTDKTATATPVTITISPIITPSVSISPSVNAAFCAGSPVTFTATANTPNPAYQWQINGANTGSTSATFTSAVLADGDKVSCTITASASCVAVQTATSNIFTVSIIPGFTLSPIISTASTNVCNGEAVTFNLTPLSANVALSYQWQVNGQSVQSANLTTFTSSTLKDGDVVTCMVGAANGCSGPFTSNSLTVHMPTITFNISPTAIKKGASITLSPAISGTVTSYQWSPAVGLSDATIAKPVASPSVTTTYQLTVTTAAGCKTIASVTIPVIIEVEIPNSFTPNGDGINDTWKISSLSIYPNNVVDIFTRAGQLVFHSAGYATPWDGTKNGSTLPTGVYFYVIDPKTGIKPLSGSVTIIR